MKKYYADIILDIAVEQLDHTFQYSIPEELQASVKEGCRVRVPFGIGNTVREGYVFSISDTPKIPEEKIKNIIECIPMAVTVEEKLFALAAWMRLTYGSTMIQALKTVLPVKNKVKVKEERSIAAAGDEAAFNEYLEKCAKKHFVAKERLLRAVKEEKLVSWDRAVKELKVPGATIKLLEGAGYIAVLSEAAYRTGLSFDPSLERRAPSELTPAQNSVCKGILSEWKNSARTCLIQGVTGSGKTNIYIKLINDICESGRQAILLIPEISLTWQIVSRFYAVFGDKVAVLHSRLSPGERSDMLERVKKGLVSLVIGPRSALFTPFSDLGLIIIDEEHENSYQSEVTPRYDARETAIERARLENAHVVLGSATPSTASRYSCELGEYAFFRIDERYGNAVLPEVEITDMKKELAAGNAGPIGLPLRTAIEDRLSKKEQIILFLNRRGHTGYLSCRSCGYVVKCPHCDVSLTLHANNRLMCHYCGYTKPMITKCPECSSPFISGFQVGTQQIEELLKKDYPETVVARMDRDTVKNADDYERILKGFANKEADILLGTQMIVKGHDFPGVTLVGALSADGLLFSSDYRASERTFQLLCQAVGRAGRGDKPGKAIIQTSHPEHYAITAASLQDYDSFYREEIENREALGYPPAGRLIAVHASGTDEAHLDKAMEYLKSFAQSNLKEGCRILGPTEEAIAKVADRYRRVMYIKGRSRSDLIKLRLLLEKYIDINRGFDSLQIQFDSAG